jgi:hypothetical protein
VLLAADSALVWVGIALATEARPLFLGSAYSLLVTFHHFNTRLENVYGLPNVV